MGSRPWGWPQRGGVLTSAGPERLCPSWEGTACRSRLSSGPLLVESKEQIQSQQMAGVPAKTQGHSWSCHSVWVEVCSDHPLTRVGAARGACGDTLLPPWAGHVLRLPPTCRALCTGVRLQVAQSHLLWGGRGPKQAPW